MLTRIKGSEELTQLAKKTLVENGVTPSEALTQAAGKMLVRLQDVAPTPLVSDYETMLQRCALD
jgi:hypothetical protein